MIRFERSIICLSVDAFLAIQHNYNARRRAVDFRGQQFDFIVEPKLAQVRKIFL